LAMKNFASPIAPMPEMMFSTPATISRIRKHSPTGDSVLDTGHDGSPRSIPAAGPLRPPV
jgi:hypothetical protein